MNLTCFQKISALPSSAEDRPQYQKGSISLMVTLLFLVFSLLGMSLLLLSRIHLKIGAARKHSAVLDYASENGLKKVLGEIMELLDSRDRLTGLSDDRLACYRADAIQHGNLIVEDFFGRAFPWSAGETREGMTWDAETVCSLEKIEDGEDDFAAAYELRIDSEANLKGFRPKKTSGLDAVLEVLAGRLPLPCLPLLINKRIPPTEKETFLKEKGITLRPGPDGKAIAGPLIKDEPVIPKDASSLLAKALKIRIFHPEDLDNASLRRAIGLEISDETVPEGVYLIKDDLGLGGVFIQGDVEEMITAVDGEFQWICFRAAGGEWLLKFSPIAGKTFFITPEASWSYNLVPTAIIAVNGKIASLGGGVVDAFGHVVSARDEAIPSILSGINLTIMSSEGVTISTHLVSQGVRWRDGIPYLKDSETQLVIYSTGRDFLSGAEEEGGISIAEGSPQNLTVDASLIAQGKGFVIEGEGKDIEVLGGIQAVDYASGGSCLHLTPVTWPNGLLYPGNAPRTEEPMLFISSFEILEWREY